MNSLWLKIKIWTKIIFFAAVAIYTLMFFTENWGTSVQLWVFFGTRPQPPVLLLVFLTLCAGVVGTLLVGTAVRTVRQVREMRDRTRSERLQREMADMKAKAEKLQTRPEQGKQESGGEASQ